MEEYWKQITGYEQDYMISNLGKVASIKKGFHLIKLGKHYKGYVTAQLWKDGKRKLQYTHRLVAKEFVYNPDNKPQVNHIDCKRENNNYKNLEWVTSYENYNHAIKFGYN